MMMMMVVVVLQLCARALRACLQSCVRFTHTHWFKHTTTTRNNNATLCKRVRPAQQCVNPSNTHWSSTCPPRDLCLWASWMWMWMRAHLTKLVAVLRRALGRRLLAAPQGRCGVLQARCERVQSAGSVALLTAVLLGLLVRHLHFQFRRVRTARHVTPNHCACWRTGRVTWPRARSGETVLRVISQFHKES